MAKKKKRKNKNPGRDLYKSIKNNDIKKKVRKLNKKLKASPFHKAIKSFEDDVNNNPLVRKKINTGVNITNIKIFDKNPLNIELYGGKSLLGFLTMKFDDYLANRRYRYIDTHGKGSEIGDKNVERITTINKIIKEDPDSYAVKTLLDRVHQLDYDTKSGNISKSKDAILDKKLLKALDKFEKDYDKEQVKGDKGKSTQYESDFKALLDDNVSPSEYEILLYSTNDPKDFVEGIIQFIDEYETFDKDYQQNFEQWLTDRWNSVTAEERFLMRCRWKKAGFKCDY